MHDVLPRMVKNIVISVDSLIADIRQRDIDRFVDIVSY